MKTSEQTPLIYSKIIAVMNDISAIGKTRRNQGQGYNYRGIDEIYNELHDHMAKHGIFTVPIVLDDKVEERTTTKGGLLLYRILKVKYRFFAEDGSHVSAIVTGEGMDSGDKASNKAMTSAHKYALLQVFAIPTEETKDSEHDSHELKPNSQSKPKELESTPKPPEPPYDPLAERSIYVHHPEQQKLVIDAIKSIGGSSDRVKALYTGYKERKATMKDVVADLKMITNEEVPF